jgi:hypothetical protein
MLAEPDTAEKTLLTVPVENVTLDPPVTHPVSLY